MADGAANPSHKGRKIQSYSVAFKLKVIELPKRENNSHAARVFGVDRKWVIEWRKAENELSSVDKQGQRKRLPGGGRKVVY